MSPPAPGRSPVSPSPGLRRERRPEPPWPRAGEVAGAGTKAGDAGG